MTAMRQTWHFMVRDTRALLRQPWFVGIVVIQPVIWLLLFGALFKRITDLPGFGTGNYIQYLTPGVVVMTAFSSAGWSGMSIINELERGTMDRLLVSPMIRAAMIAGRLAQAGLQILLQSLIIIALALVTGATFPGGVVGLIALMAVGVVLGCAFGGLSNALALVLREEQSVIGANTMLLLPLTFLSTAFLPKQLMPDWIQKASAFNPVNWAIEAGRTLTSSSTDWGLVGSRSAWLLLFLLVAGALATRAFRVYQRSV